MQNEPSTASRAHRLFRHFTPAGLSKIPKPELVENAAREFGSPKRRKRALTLPVMVWLGLYMALERAKSIEKALVSAWSELRTLVGRDPDRSMHGSANGGRNNRQSPHRASGR